MNAYFHADFDKWFSERLNLHRFRVEQIPFEELDNWFFDHEFGHLRHKSGKFFSIEGVQVETNFQSVRTWNQPIINQPEVGFLGFIVKRVQGCLHFLMQAKMEPGNIGFIQLAPTLQATRSNFTRVHKGTAPLYLEYFQEKKRFKVLVDSLQSEQGGRFLRKRNRNIIIEIPEGEVLPESEDFMWLTLPEIQNLMRVDNVINMDARAVLSCLPPEICGSVWLNPHEAENMHRLRDILSWFTELKCKYDLNIRTIPLRNIAPWVIDGNRIFHPSGNFFEVIAVRVEAESREVQAWTQPILKPCREGIIAFVLCEFKGQPHFLMQGKVEAGNFDIVEMAPTVQCLTGDYRRVAEELRPPFLDYVLNAPKEALLFDTRQSEEGGRFYREENRNMIVRLGDGFPATLPENFIWVSLGQLKELMRFNNVVNVQARCLLSAVTSEMVKV